jgi:hypothetical protein
MRRHLPGTALLVAVLSMPHLNAAPEDTKAPEKKGGLVDSASLTPGPYTGTLKTTPGSDRTFVITITTQDLVATTSAKTSNPALTAIAKTKQQIQQAQAQYANARTAKQAQKALDKLTQLQAKLRTQLAQAAKKGAKAKYKVVTNTRDIEFQHTTDVKVRTHILPPKLDDKGKPVKYTKEEKLALKGEGKDRKLPGYQSALEKLEAGQTVKVTLAKAPKPAKEKKNKDLDPEESKDEKKKDEEKKLQVWLIEILPEPDVDADKGGGKKKGG